MDILIATGSASLGVVVGWMVHSTFVRQERVDAKVLASTVSVMVGAGVIGIFHEFAGSKSAPLPREVYVYPIGLLLGVIATPILKFIKEADSRSDEEERQKQKESNERLEKEMEEAKELVVKHIAAKGFEMMSFETLRKELGRGHWSGDFFHSIIAKYPDELRNANLSGRRAIAIVRR